MTEATPMDDLTITKLCAEAMGYDPVFGFHYFDENTGRGTGDRIIFANGVIYCPLHDDAQAMALVKKFDLTCHNMTGRNCERPTKDRSPIWAVYFESMVVSMIETDDGRCEVIELPEGCNDDLNRAICECCAKMMLARKGASNDAKAQGGGR